MHLSPSTVCLHLVRSKWVNGLLFYIAALQLIVSRASVSSGASADGHKLFLPPLALFNTSTHMEGGREGVQAKHGQGVVQLNRWTTCLTLRRKQRSEFTLVKMTSHCWGHNRNRAHKSLERFYTATDSSFVNTLQHFVLISAITTDEPGE